MGHFGEDVFADLMNSKNTRDCMNNTTKQTSWHSAAPELHKTRSKQQRQQLQTYSHTYSCSQFCCL